MFPHEQQHFENLMTWRREPGISQEERHDRKTATHGLIYGGSSQQIKEFLMNQQNGVRELPLHLRMLDAGDVTAMKLMQMDEQQYRVWLFDIEMEDRVKSFNQIRREVQQIKANLANDQSEPAVLGAGHLNAPSYAQPNRISAGPPAPQPARSAL